LLFSKFGKDRLEITVALHEDICALLREFRAQCDKYLLKRSICRTKVMQISKHTSFCQYNFP